MFNEDSELLFVSSDEDLRRVYANQNEDGEFVCDIFESNEQFTSNNVINAIPKFERKKAKVEVNNVDSHLRYYFPGILYFCDFSTITLY